MSGCTGHCCRALTLPYGPAELVQCRDEALQRQEWDKQAWEAYVASDHQGIPKELADAYPGNATSDILQIYDMVVYVGYQDISGMMDAREPGQSEHVYRCRNLQDDGRCGVYATRPLMCSGYPYGGRCDYKACTWKQARSDHPPSREKCEDEGRAECVAELRRKFSTPYSYPVLGEPERLVPPRKTED